MMIFRMILAIIFVLFRSIETNATTDTTSDYSSALTTNHPLYSRPDSSSSDHYYEAIQLTVNVSGLYNIRSISNMDTHGFLYNETFDPFNPSIDLIEHNDDGAGNEQFKLDVYLEADVPYVLVVSTHGSRITGSFSVVANGPGEVEFIPLTIAETTTRTTSTTGVPSTLLYTGVLTSNNPNYTRYGRSEAGYYYHVMDIRIDSTGNYTFKSSSSIGDTYGYLYQGNFYPNYPQYNLITEDDDGAGSGQFRITAILRSDILYKLVFTTYEPRKTGSFSIIVSGPL